MSHDAPHDSARSQRPSLPWGAVGRLGVGADPFAWAGDSSRPPPPRSGQNPATQRLSGRQVRAGHGASLLAGSRAPRFDGYAWQRRHSLTPGLSAWRPAVCCSGRQAVRLPGKQRHPLASLIDSSPRGFGLGVFSPALGGQCRPDAALPCAGFAQVALPPRIGPGLRLRASFPASARCVRSSPAGRNAARPQWLRRLRMPPFRLGRSLGAGPSFPAPSVRRRQVCQHLAAAGRSSIGAAGAPMGRSRCAEPSPLRHGQPLVEMLAVAERRGRAIPPPKVIR